MDRAKLPKTARDFLALDSGTLPSATLPGDEWGGDAWESLRALAAGDVCAARGCAGSEGLIRLHAQEDAWNASVTVNVMSEHRHEDLQRSSRAVPLCDAESLEIDG